MRIKSRVATIVAVVLAVAGVVIAPPAPGLAAPGVRYTMVAFSNASDRDMDVYQSADGTRFDVVRKSAYRPTTGRVRDASVFRHSDGRYYVTYTTANGATIGFASSSDRVTWTHLMDYPLPICCFLQPGTGDGTGQTGITGSSALRSVPSLSPFTTKAWAPEWFVEDGRVNIVVSLSTGGGFVPYLMTALDSSLRRWSLPTPIKGLGADRIDTTIVKVGAKYHAFTKNETKKVIEHAVASQLGGPYSFVAPGDWGRLVEGPAVVQLPNGDWRLYLDAYTTGKYLYSDSSDGMVTWSTPRELPGLSGAVRHIGVMREVVAG